MMESSDLSNDDGSQYLDYPMEDAPQNWLDEDNSTNDGEDRVTNHYLSDVIDGVWGPTVTTKTYVYYYTSYYL
jgi:hypothetical protein